MSDLAHLDSELYRSLSIAADDFRQRIYIYLRGREPPVQVAEANMALANLGYLFARMASAMNNPYPYNVPGFSEVSEADCSPSRHIAALSLLAEIMMRAQDEFAAPDPTVLKVCREIRIVARDMRIEQRAETASAASLQPKKDSINNGTTTEPMNVRPERHSQPAAVDVHRSETRDLPCIGHGTETGAYYSIGGQMFMINLPLRQSDLQGQRSGIILELYALMREQIITRRMRASQYSPFRQSLSMIEREIRDRDNKAFGPKANPSAPDASNARSEDGLSPKNIGNISGSSLANRKSSAVGYLKVHERPSERSGSSAQSTDEPREPCKDTSAQLKDLGSGEAYVEWAVINGHGLHLHHPILPTDFDRKAISVKFVEGLLAWMQNQNKKRTEEELKEPEAASRYTARAQSIPAADIWLKMVRITSMEAAGLRSNASDWTSVPFVPLTMDNQHEAQDQAADDHASSVRHVTDEAARYQTNSTTAPGVKNPATKHQEVSEPKLKEDPFGHPMAAIDGVSSGPSSTLGEAGSDTAEKTRIARTDDMARYINVEDAEARAEIPHALPKSTMHPLDARIFAQFRSAEPEAYAARYGPTWLPNLSSPVTMTAYLDVAKPLAHKQGESGTSAQSQQE